MREMNRGYRRSAALRLSAFLLGALLFAGSSATPALATEDGPVVWMKVEVYEGGSQKVKVNIPLSMIEVFVDSMDGGRFLNHIEAQHPGLDMARMWQEVRDTALDEFVTIETDEESVRVWKDSEYFRVDVQEFRNSEPNIRMTIPLSVMDYLFDPDRSTLNFQEMVGALRGYLPMTLLEADKDGESVRIWLEEN